MSCLTDVRRLHNMLHYFGDLLGGELTATLAVIQPVDARIRDRLLGEAALAKFDAVLTPVEPGGKRGKKAKKQGAKRRKTLQEEIEVLVTTQQTWLQESREELHLAWQDLNASSFRHILALTIAVA